jgi:hypothetical protein
MSELALNVWSEISKDDVIIALKTKKIGIDVPYFTIFSHLVVINKYYNVNVF